jgi:hypothetical protein
MLEKRACMQSIDCHLVFGAEQWQGFEVLMAKISVNSDEGQGCGKA